MKLLDCCKNSNISVTLHKHYKPTEFTVQCDNCGKLTLGVGLTATAIKQWNASIERGSNEISS